jgi:hypothetical protein
MKIKATDDAAEDIRAVDTTTGEVIPYVTEADTDAGTLRVLRTDAAGKPLLPEDPEDDFPIDELRRSFRLVNIWTGETVAETVP